MQQIIRVNRQGHKFRSKIILRGHPPRGRGDGAGVLHTVMFLVSISYSNQSYNLLCPKYLFNFFEFHFITLQGRCSTTNDHK